jgi:hypothetical protein
MAVSSLPLYRAKVSGNRWLTCGLTLNPILDIRPAKTPKFAYANPRTIFCRAYRCNVFEWIPMIDAAASVSRSGAGAQDSEPTGFLIVGSTSRSEPFIEEGCIDRPFALLERGARTVGLPSNYSTDSVMSAAESNTSCLWCDTFGLSRILLSVARSP